MLLWIHESAVLLEVVIGFAILLVIYRTIYEYDDRKHTYYLVGLTALMAAFGGVFSSSLNFPNPSIDGTLDAGIDVTMDYDNDG